MGRRLISAIAALVLLCFTRSALAGGAIPLRSEKLEFKLNNEKRIEATLRIPTHCREGTRFPVWIIFGGFEEAGRVLELIHPKDAVILASFDYPYDGKRTFEFPDTILEAGKLKQSLKDTNDAILKWVELLKARKDVDRTQIVIIGASFGAPFAIRAASRTQDLDTLVIVHGFANVRATISHRLASIWSRRLGFLSSPAAWIASSVVDGVLDPPEPLDDAPRLMASQMALMIEATDDTFIPFKARESLWRALLKSGAQVRRIQMPGEHLQPGGTDLIDRIMDLSVEEVKRAGRLRAPEGCPSQVSSR
jgi:dienelactone hydrolase